MGDVQHEAVLVTTSTKEAEELAKRALDLGLQVIGPSAPQVNGYATICIVPDGSKVGWTTNIMTRKKRDLFCRELDHQHVDYVRVSYGDFGSSIVPPTEDDE